jgi:signal transduction histidine kinase
MLRRLLGVRLLEDRVESYDFNQIMDTARSRYLLLVSLSMLVLVVVLVPALLLAGEHRLRSYAFLGIAALIGTTTLLLLWRLRSPALPITLFSLSTALLTTVAVASTGGLMSGGSFWLLIVPLALPFQRRVQVPSALIVLLGTSADYLALRTGLIHPGAGPPPSDVRFVVFVIGFIFVLAMVWLFGTLVGSYARTLIELLQQRVRAEKQARRAQLRVRDALRAQSVFVSLVSHELRTPVNVVTGFAELLSQSTHLPPEEHEQAVFLVEAARRLALSVEEVLRLARLDAEPDFTRPEARLDPVALVHGALEAFNSEGRGGARLGYQLKAPEAPLYIRGDENSLKQAVISLLLALVSALPDLTMLKIALARLGDTVQIALDLPAQIERPLIMETVDLPSVWRAGAERMSMHWLILQVMVEAHQGSVRIVDAPGGTRVTLIFPCELAGTDLRTLVAST